MHVKPYQPLIGSARSVSKCRQYNGVGEAMTSSRHCFEYLPSRTG